MPAGPPFPGSKGTGSTARPGIREAGPSLGSARSGRSFIALIPLAELFKLRWAVNHRMHGLVYEYEVVPARTAWFEETYGPNGRWAGFFGDGAGYLGSELLRDAMRPGRYLVIDRWASAEDAARFLADRAEEYERRSRGTAHLYLHEVRLGAFDVVTAG
jgi:heme-degrading monooxygenase HmoA